MSYPTRVAVAVAMEFAKETRADGVRPVHLAFGCLQAGGNAACAFPDVSKDLDFKARLELYATRFQVSDTHERVELHESGRSAIRMGLESEVSFVDLVRFGRIGIRGRTLSTDDLLLGCLQADPMLSELAASEGIRLTNVLDAVHRMQGETFRSKNQPQG